MKNRFKDAIAIDDGACNPIAIVNAIRDNMNVMRTRDKIVGHPPLFEDPALRLMVHQLAHLFNVTYFSEYGECRKFCELNESMEQERIDALPPVDILEVV